MSETIYGVLQTEDFLKAAQFATDQVNRELCSDPDIKTKYCRGADCLRWRPAPQDRIWEYPCADLPQKCGNIPCPYPFTCNSSTGHCQYCPDEKDIEVGQCEFTNEDVCKQFSVYPYQCTSNKCEDKPKDQIEGKAYLEWREPKCNEYTICLYGKCTNGKCQCQTDNDCRGAQTCQNGLCEGNSCVVGNASLKRFCEVPSERTPISSDMGKDPSLAYNPYTGKCNVSNLFCERNGSKFQGKSCKTDNDCGSKQVCYNGNCSGDDIGCDKPSSGERIGEFFLGKTIYKWIKNGFHCPEGFKLIKPADPKLMVEKTVVSKDFAAEGIHLYQIFWKKEALQKPLIQLGFDASEVAKKYPKVVKKINGTKCIVLGLEDIKANNELKRCYVMLNLTK